MGTNGDDSLNLIFWFDAGSGFNARTASLGQQSGTFDLAHVSIVEGDATLAPDPFEYLSIGTVLTQCYRYYETLGGFGVYAYQSAGQTIMSPVAFKATKRKTPTMGAIGWATATNSGLQQFYNVDVNGAMFGVNAGTTGVVEMRGYFSSADAEL